MPQTGFSWLDPATWIPAAIAAAYGFYKIARVLSRDRRDDKNERTVDQATLQIITALREELSRVTVRMRDVEAEMVRVHRERQALIEEIAQLKTRLAAYETAAQPRLL